MQHPNQFSPRKEAATEPLPLSQRVIHWLQQGWRPAGTVFAVALALAFAWSVINGRHGLSTWYGQHSQEKQLKNEIQQLEDENARIRQHVDRLKNDPDAIEHEAREKLHYARPGEVIYSLPPDRKQPPASTR